MIPLAHAEEGLSELLMAIADAGVGSFLAVLKRFGAQDSKFSFPMEGYTLALDFPVQNKSLGLVEKLDSITVRHGGRFYLAKDSRVGRDMFWQSEGRAESYASYRKDIGASIAYRSAQSARLGL